MGELRILREAARPIGIFDDDGLRYYVGVSDVVMVGGVRNSCRVGTFLIPPPPTVCMSQ